MSCSPIVIASQLLLAKEILPLHMIWPLHSLMASSGTKKRCVLKEWSLFSRAHRKVVLVRHQPLCIKIFLDLMARIWWCFRCQEGFVGASSWFMTPRW